MRSETLSESFPGSEVSLLLKTYEPAPGRTLAPRGHEGEEFIHIIEGRLRVTSGANHYDLEAGDSVHFKSLAPHSFENIGDGTCVVLLATCPRYSL